MIDGNSISLTIFKEANKTIIKDVVTPTRLKNKHNAFTLQGNLRVTRG